MRRKRHFLFLCIGLLVVVITAETLALFLSPFQKPVTISQASEATLAALADRAIQLCQSAGYKPDCYDNEIPKLAAQLSLADGFAITRLLQEKDHGFAYCHVLGHKLGALAVDKDPGKWKDIAAECPSDLCSNGCIHGVFQEHFRQSQQTTTLSAAQLARIVPELTDICEVRSSWHPTQLEQASCYHALGHLLMYVTSADVVKSLTFCTQTAQKQDGRSYVHLCDDGVFMQIYQPLEPEDFALIKGKEVDRTHYLSFCNGFTGMARGSCISEGWPLYAKEILTPSGLFAFCEQELAAEKDRCFQGLLYVVTAQLQFDVQKLSVFCQGMSADKIGECAATVASRFIETDYRNVPRSLTLCNTVASVDPQNRCYQQLVSFASYNFHRGSPEFFSLCGALPDPWKGACFRS